MTAAVAGIDPAVGGTGYAGPDGRTWILTERPNLGPYERISRIADRVVRLVDDHRPGLVVVEGYGAGGPGRLSAVRSIELGGLLRVELLRRRVPWVEVAPSTLKAYAAGTGRADKVAMAAALEARFCLDPAGLGHDEIDALWLRDVGRWLLADDAVGPHPETGGTVVAGLIERTRTVVMAVGLRAREDP